MNVKHGLLPNPVFFLGARIFPWTMVQTLQEIGRRLDAGEFTQHCVVNVAKVVNMRLDVSLRDAVNECDIINIDGMGLVWGARILGVDVPERVAGIDLFFSLLSLAVDRGDSVFFLGARKDVVNEVVRRIHRDYPLLKIAGWHDGYFWDDEGAVVKQIADSGATMLFVGISSPKKEQFVYRWRDQLGVKFAMGVGGTFDIVAGKVRRAPFLMQRVGLEWLFRVVQEPRRMWRRYFVTNSIFMGMLFWELVHSKLKEKTGRN